MPCLLAAKRQPVQLPAPSQAGYAARGYAPLLHPECRPLGPFVDRPARGTAAEGRPVQRLQLQLLQARKGSDHV